MKTYIQLLPATLNHHKSKLFKCYGIRLKGHNTVQMHHNVML